MRRLLLVIVLALLARPALADDAALKGLAADYEAWALADDPITAGREGDKAALARLPDVTLVADAARKQALEGFRARLERIAPQGLSDEARLNRDFLRWTLDRRLKSLAFDEARLPFNSDGGFDIELDYVASTMNLDSEADARAWIARLNALPDFFAANLENARRGMKGGFTQPVATTQAVIARAAAEVARPVAGDPLLKPFATLPATSLPSGKPPCARKPPGSSATRSARPRRPSPTSSPPTT